MVYEYIYLLQLREFIKTGEQVYKIGRTTRKPEERFQEYPKNSRVLTFVNVVICTKAERELLKIFNKKFIQRKEYGKEYFEGDVVQMVREIYEYWMMTFTLHIESVDEDVKPSDVLDISPQNSPNDFGEKNLETTKFSQQKCIMKIKSTRTPQKKFDHHVNLEVTSAPPTKCATIFPEIVVNIDTYHPNSELVAPQSEQHHVVNGDTISSRLLSGKLSGYIDKYSKNKCVKIKKDILLQLNPVLTKKSLILKKHTDDRELFTSSELECPICQRTFSDKRALKYHVDHSVCTKNRFICSLCNKEFTTLKGLQYHQENNVCDKPY